MIGLAGFKWVSTNIVTKFSNKSVIGSIHNAVPNFGIMIQFICEKIERFHFFAKVTKNSNYSNNTTDL